MKTFLNSDLAEVAIAILLLGSFFVSAVALRRAPEVPVAATEQQQPVLSSMANVPSTTKARERQKAKR